MRLRPFILCFNRTAFTVQKSGLKSSAFRPGPFPRISPKSYRYNAVPNRFSTPRTNAPRLFSRVKAGIHTQLSEKSRTQRHTRRNRGHFGWGGITTLGAFRTFTNIPGPGIRKVYFAAFGSWPGVLPKNTESLRDSDALMRVAVPRRRGPAGLRDLFRFCRNCGLYILRSGLSACARHGWYHYPQRIYVLLKRRTDACQNGSFAVF